MFGLFKNQQLLDEASIQWMMDCYAWALRNFDAHIFYNDTRLVLPNNEYFPGEDQNALGKANLILQQVKHHAGLENWPVRIVEEEEYLSSSLPTQSPRLLVHGAIRGHASTVPELAGPEKSLLVVNQPQLLRNPQALIANYAQMLAHYLGHTASEQPPGDLDNWPHVTEVLAVFLGFGLMFANTAYNVRVSSCGACQGPSTERVNYLSQYDITYALAIFSVLKNIPNKEVLSYLKKTLHPFYKKAVKDVVARQEIIGKLKGFNA